LLTITHKHIEKAKAAGFLLPFLLYEDLILASMMIVVGMILLYAEKIDRAIRKLDWREFVFFLYMFHMLFGEREFAYLGLEPLFVTEIVLAILTIGYAKDLLRIRRVLFVYYLVVLIGLLYAFLYLFWYQIDAIRDSFMLIYAFWVPIVYHVFRGRKHYNLFFLFLKLFIVLKGIAYLYEGIMIALGYKSINFEGFRFGVGYILPPLVVMTIFLPFKHIGRGYKIIALLMIPAVFTIFHRSIFLGVMLAVAAFFLIGNTPIRKKILLYGTTSFVVLIVFLIYYNSIVDVDIFSILERKSSLDEGNINYRFISWQVVLEKFYEHFILGFGVGRPLMYAHNNIFYTSVELSYFQIRDLAGNAQPHNSYLNILTRFGILLFPFFAVAVFKPLAKVKRMAAHKMRNGFHACSMLLFLVGFLLFMYVLAFFNVVLEGPHHSFPFWLAIGMLLSFERAGNLHPRKIRITRPKNYSR